MTGAIDMKVKTHVRAGALVAPVSPGVGGGRCGA